MKIFVKHFINGLLRLNLNQNSKNAKKYRNPIKKLQKTNLCSNIPFSSINLTDFNQVLSPKDPNKVTVIQHQQLSTRNLQMIR